jgi:Glycosyltransferase 61
MTFREQVKAIREAEVLVGNHGAGLSHLVFMDNNSHVIEFEMNFLRFFNHLSACKQGCVTLHQLPDVRGSISDGYFNNLLLPEFLRIYGIPQQPKGITSAKQPQVLVDSPIPFEQLQTSTFTSGDGGNGQSGVVDGHENFEVEDGILPGPEEVEADQKQLTLNSNQKENTGGDVGVRKSTSHEGNNGTPFSKHAIDPRFGSTSISQT